MKITPRHITKKILQLLGLHAPLMAALARRKFWKLQKQREDSIMSFQRRFNYDIFIETGTYHGDMVEAMRKRFKKIYSIEIGDELYNKARDRFRQYNHIKIILGDSCKTLPIILAEVNGPALFWLDAHDSGGDTARGDVITPIEQELAIIMRHPIKNHIILIDDARDFTGRGGYPSAQRIKDIAFANNYKFELKNDNFRLWQ